MVRKRPTWKSLERGRIETDRILRKRARNGTLDLVHWQDVHDHIIYVPYGWLNNSEYKLMVDNISGQEWYCRVLPNGELTTQTAREHFIDHHNRMITLKELRYTTYQYEAMRTCMWRMSTQDWTSPEIFALLTSWRFQWDHLPGQTPLTVGKVGDWYDIHVQQLRKGIEWP